MVNWPKEFPLCASRPDSGKPLTGVEVLGAFLIDVKLIYDPLPKDTIFHDTSIHDGPSGQSKTLLQCKVIILKL